MTEADSSVCNPNKPARENFLQGRIRRGRGGCSWRRWTRRCRPPRASRRHRSATPSLTPGATASAASPPSPSTCVSNESSCMTSSQYKIFKKSINQSVHNILLVVPNDRWIADKCGTVCTFWTVIVKSSSSHFVSLMTSFTGLLLILAFKKLGTYSSGNHQISTPKHYQQSRHVCNHIFTWVVEWFPQIVIFDILS